MKYLGKHKDGYNAYSPDKYYLHWYKNTIAIGKISIDPYEKKSFHYIFKYVVLTHRIPINSDHFGVWRGDEIFELSEEEVYRHIVMEII